MRCMHHLRAARESGLLSTVQVQGGKNGVFDVGILLDYIYLYIQGHHLFDLVVSPLVQSVCDTLRNVRENEIRDRLVQALLRKLHLSALLAMYIFSLS